MKYWLCQYGGRDTRTRLLMHKAQVGADTIRPKEEAQQPVGEGLCALPVALMKNEAGDKSPNEAALSVLIEGEALTLVPLRSTARGASKFRI